MNSILGVFFFILCGARTGFDRDVGEGKAGADRSDTRVKLEPNALPNFQRQIGCRGCRGLVANGRMGSRTHAFNELIGEEAEESITVSFGWIRVTQGSEVGLLTAVEPELVRMLLPRFCSTKRSSQARTRPRRSTNP